MTNRWGLLPEAVRAIKKALSCSIEAASAISSKPVPAAARRSGT
jgi:hypothetical protein